jgi:hypothetical protein
LNPGATSTENLFGPGVYTTDSPTIAQGYAANKSRRRGVPSIYGARSGFNKIMDLDTPANAETIDMIRHAAGHIDPEVGDAVTGALRPGATGSDLYTALRRGISDYSHAEGIPGHEFDDSLHMLSESFRKSGVDAFTHTGGLRTNAGQAHGPHQVVIGLDPNDMGRVAPATPYKSWELLKNLLAGEHGAAKAFPSEWGRGAIGSEEAAGLAKSADNPLGRFMAMGRATPANPSIDPSDLRGAFGAPREAKDGNPFALYQPGGDSFSSSRGKLISHPGTMLPNTNWGAWRSDDAMGGLLHRLEDSGRKQPIVHNDLIAAHEAGHAFHVPAVGRYANKVGLDASTILDPSAMRGLELQIKSHLGEYANSDPSEFVAEGFAKQLLGRDNLPPDLQRLYDSYRGPDINKLPAKFRSQFPGFGGMLKKLLGGEEGAAKAFPSEWGGHASQIPANHLDELADMVRLDEPLPGSLGFTDRRAAGFESPRGLRYNGKLIGTSQAAHPSRMEANAADRFFPDAYNEGEKVRRIEGTEVSGSKQGKGLGQALYLDMMGNHPRDWFYNSQASRQAAHAADALERKGLIEHYRNPGTGEQPHLGRITDAGLEKLSHPDLLTSLMAGKGFPEPLPMPPRSPIKPSVASAPGFLKRLLSGEEGAAKAFPSEWGGFGLKYDGIHKPPEGIARNDPEWVNNKTWWHGTGVGGLSPSTLDISKTNPGSLYGRGIYKTENAEIANSYAKNAAERDLAGIDYGSTPTLYRGRSDFGKILDLHQPMTDDVREALAAMAKSHGDEVSALKTGKTSAGARDFLEHSRIDTPGKIDARFLDDPKSQAGAAAEMVGKLGKARANIDWVPGMEPILKRLAKSGREFPDASTALVDALTSRGYHGMTHTGGGRNGVAEHQVMIGLDPSKYREFGPAGPHGAFESKPILSGEPIDANYLKGLSADPLKAGQPWYNAAEINSEYGVPTHVVSPETWAAKGYNPGAAAQYLPRDHAIELNMGFGRQKIPGFGMTSGVWKDGNDMRQMMDHNFLQGHFSGFHRDHLAYHELGHALHRDSLGKDAFIAGMGDKFPKNYEPLIRDAVGNYAATNPAELVAEVYAGLRGGRQFDPDKQRVIRSFMKDLAGTPMLDGLSNTGIGKGIGLAALLSAGGLHSSGINNNN